jgi:hypothetical protein
MRKSEVTYEELEFVIKNHLACVHGDAGEHTGDHGLKKSIADATEKWYKLRERLDRHSWIPVEIVTPGTPVKVAVWSSSTGHATAFYHSGFWIETYSELPVVDVTHWKMLSEPPKT